MPISASHPCAGGADLAVRVEPHHRGHQVDARHSIDHAVVHLGDHREAVVLEPVDEPHLPERAVTIELLRHDATGQPLEAPDVAGHGQARMAHVIVEVEPGVVDPHRMREERHPRELLAKPRVPLQRAFRHRADALDVDAAVLRAQGLRVEDADRADVHVDVGVLEGEKSGVQSRQPLVMLVGHGRGKTTKRARLPRTLPAGWLHRASPRASHG
jgi:hypothetical protein